MIEANICVLSGGTGTPKLLQGIARIVDEERLVVIVNTGEDNEISGLYVSPDVDTVLYTLAGIVDESKWYGIRGDTFRCHEMLARLGYRELLRIGDMDRAVKLHRTLLLRSGMKLSQAIDLQRRALGVKARILPMTDDRVVTRLVTTEGEMHFHDFWVARRGRPRVLSVRYDGSEEAKPAEGVLESIENSDVVVVGPSNPITSIGPILSIREIRRSLRKAYVVAVSPIVGEEAISGPAGKLMRDLGMESTPYGVAKLYSDFLDIFFIHESDLDQAERIEDDLGIGVVRTNIMMPDLESRVRLAGEILNILGT